MQRWLFAAAALLLGSASVSRADYVIIRFCVNMQAQGGAQQMGNPPMGNPGVVQKGAPGNFNGAGVGGGFAGAPIGGQFGGRPGGFNGMPGGFNGMPGGFNGMPGGINGGPPAAMRPPGAPMPVGGGFNGQPPGGFNGQPGGFNGQPGGFNGQPMGFNGAQPMGFNGGQPMGGQPGSAIQPTDFSKLLPDDYVTAVVELKGPKKTFQQKVDNAGTWTFINHKWNKTAVWDDGSVEFNWQIVTAAHNQIYTPLERYTRDRRTALARGNLDDLLALAETCLQIGLPDKCIEVLTELEGKINEPGAGKKGNNERVTKAMTAFKKIKSILSDPIAKDDKAKVWKTKLGYGMAPSKHYVLLNNSADKERDGVQRRLDALENTFKSYYLVFAIKGKALPAPTEKLVAILSDTSDNFNKQRRAFDSGDLVSDGYYARQHNLAIFSPNRIDAASRNFEQTMRDVWRKNDTDLFSGKFPDLGPKKEAPLKANEVARAQTLALIDKALREESEIASATHEGAAQLLAETGILPRTVNAPQWLRYGLPSLFDLTKGPFPIYYAVAFYPGALAPSWAWGPYFDSVVVTTSGPPAKEFLDTIYDVYFDAAHDLQKSIKEAKLVSEPKEMAKGQGGPGVSNPPPGPGNPPGPMGANPKDPRGGPEGELRAAFARAHCTSWALNYYLFSDRFDEFQAFLAELAALPRDAEIDHEAVNAALKKALKLDKLDVAALIPGRPYPRSQELDIIADHWAKFIHTHPAPGFEGLRAKVGAPAAK